MSLKSFVLPKIKTEEEANIWIKSGGKFKPLKNVKFKYGKPLPQKITSEEKWNFSGVDLMTASQKTDKQYLQEFLEWCEPLGYKDTAERIKRMLEEFN